MGKKYKILGISGSPREGSTNYMLRTVLDATASDYELIALKDKRIAPCHACGGCFKSHKCVIKDDMQELYNKMSEANIIVLASPTYFSNVTGLMKNFIDRCLPLYLSEALREKRVALISVGNFKKNEVMFSDGFDIDKAIKDPSQRKVLISSVKKCLTTLKSFSVNHMGMQLIGNVAAINSDVKIKSVKLAKLGKKIIS